MLLNYAHHFFILRQLKNALWRQAMYFAGFLSGSPALWQINLPSSLDGTSHRCSR